MIARTVFAQTLVLPCSVQRQSPGFATTAAALAHREKIVGLRAVDGLVQPSLEASLTASDAMCDLFTSLMTSRSYRH